MSSVGSTVNVATAVVYDPAGGNGYFMQVNGGVYRANPTDAAEGETQSFRITPTGELYILNRETQPLYSQGAAADNSALAGYPVRTGGGYNATLPTYDDGDQTTLQADSRGRLITSDFQVESLSKNSGAVDASTIRVKLTNEDAAILTAISNEDFATETTLDAVLGALTTLTGVDYATEATLAALAGVNFATETTLAALLTALGSVDYATEATLSALAAEDFATEVTLSSIDTKTPALGQAAKAASVPVTLASDQDPLDVVLGARSVVTRARNDYSSSSVTTAAYTELVAALSADVSMLEVFDSSGQTMVLAIGGAGSEVDQVYIMPGGQGQVPLSIPSGSRVSVKAVSATANAGEISINFYS